MNALNTEFAPKPDLEYPFERGWAPPAGKPFNVAEGVFWLRMPMPMALDHINLWLLKDGDGWVIVDSGVDSESCKAVWETVFAEFCAPELVNRIVITHLHPDHIGLASWLALRCDCSIYMTHGEFDQYRKMVTRDQVESTALIRQHFHSLGFDQDTCDATARYFKADKKPKAARVQPEQVLFIEEGDQLHINGKCWQVVCGNGHSPEHACLYNQQDNVLISGDQSLPRISSNVSVFPGSKVQDPLGNWLDSCEKLRDLIPSTTLMLPAHQEPFKRNPERMQQMIDDHHAQLNRLRLALGDSLSAVEACNVMFDRELDQFQQVLATSETMAHLRYLTCREEVTENLDEEGIARFKLVDAELPAVASNGN